MTNQTRLIPMNNTNMSKASDHARTHNRKKIIQSKFL